MNKKIDASDSFKLLRLQSLVLEQSEYLDITLHINTKLGTVTLMAQKNENYKNNICRFLESDWFSFTGYLSPDINNRFTVSELLSKFEQYLSQIELQPDNNADMAGFRQSHIEQIAKPV